MLRTRGLLRPVLVTAISAASGMLVGTAASGDTPSLLVRELPSGTCSFALGGQSPQAAVHAGPGERYRVMASVPAGAFIWVCNRGRRPWLAVDFRLSGRRCDQQQFGDPSARPGCFEHGWIREEAVDYPD